MSKGNRIALAKADELVEMLRPILEQATERFVFAGSWRRRRTLIGDLEAVVLERFMDCDLIALLLENRKAIGLRKVRGNRKPGRGVIELTLTPGWVESFKVELYISTPETWPVMLAIRTGPVAYSKSIVTPRAKGGRLKDGYHIHSGRLWHGETEEPIALESEEQFLEVYAGGWVLPADRDKAPR